MSDSVRPHGLQPTRLRRPWDSPGKNTGVGYHFLLPCMRVESQSEVAQSCPTLSDPMDCSLPGSSIHGIFQAIVLEWGAIAFSFAWLVNPNLHFDGPVHLTFCMCFHMWTKVTGSEKWHWSFSLVFHSDNLGTKFPNPLDHLILLSFWRTQTGPLPSILHGSLPHAWEPKEFWNQMLGHGTHGVRSRSNLVLTEIQAKVQ